MICYKNGGCGAYEMYSCSECPASRPEYVNKSSELKENQNGNTPFVPETLDWCCEHYVPPADKFISCSEFGNSDGMNGGCWWCMEMTPYQWNMCRDETWVRGLLSQAARLRKNTREEATAFIEQYKQKHPMKKIED